MAVDTLSYLLALDAAQADVGDRLWADIQDAIGEDEVQLVDEI